MTAVLRVLLTIVGGVLLLAGCAPTPTADVPPVTTTALTTVQAPAPVTVTSVTTATTTVAPTTSSTRTSSTAVAPGPRSTTSPARSADIPARAWTTLDKIDAGRWPPADNSGTQGGRYFGNYEGHLPEYDDRGQAIEYTEWDVNRKQRGRSRDAERIVTGSDNSAWYTDDHYATFTRMR